MGLFLVLAKLARFGSPRFCWPICLECTTVRAPDATKKIGEKKCRKFNSLMENFWGKKFGFAASQIFSFFGGKSRFKF